uniref:Uncharacterized protein n=1 Tax=Syphacia muris TaxID=451379 RepID=A0A0N5ARK1_9BILA
MRVIIGGYPAHKYITNLTKMVVEYEEENPDFRCVRDQIHVFNFTKILFLLNIGISILILGITFPWSLLALWVPFIYFFPTIWALKQHSTFWMWPAIIFHALFLLGCIAQVIVLFSTAIFSTQTVLDTFGQGHHKDWLTRLSIVMCLKIIALLVCCIALYELYIFTLCRRYFDDIKDIDLALDKEENVGLKIEDTR